jgi:hypothetical protein
LLPAIEAALNGKRFVSSSLDFSESTVPSAKGVHEILFCSDEAAIVNGLVDFVGVALNARNPVIVWATEGHQRSLLVKLREQGVEIDSALERGTYIFNGYRRAGRFSANPREDPRFERGCRKSRLEKSADCCVRGTSRPPLERRQIA